MMHDKYIVNASLKHTRYLLLQTYPPFTDITKGGVFLDVMSVRSPDRPFKVLDQVCTENIFKYRFNRSFGL